MPKTKKNSIAKKRINNIINSYITKPNNTRRINMLLKASKNIRRASQKFGFSPNETRRGNTIFKEEYIKANENMVKRIRNVYLEKNIIPMTYIKNSISYFIITYNKYKNLLNRNDKIKVHNSVTEFLKDKLSFFEKGNVSTYNELSEKKKINMNFQDNIFSYLQGYMEDNARIGQRNNIEKTDDASKKDIAMRYLQTIIYVYLVYLKEGLYDYNGEVYLDYLPKLDKELENEVFPPERFPRV